MHNHTCLYTCICTRFMNIHSNAHMVIIHSYSAPCGSHDSQLAHIFFALFSRFLCPRRAPESQQTPCSTAQLEKFCLQGRHLGPRLGTQSSLFPLLGGSLAWRWQVSLAWVLFCKQVLSRYFLPYPNIYIYLCVCVCVIILHGKGREWFFSPRLLWHLSSIPSVSVRVQEAETPLTTWAGNI